MKLAITAVGVVAIAACAAGVWLMSRTDSAERELAALRSELAEVRETAAALERRTPEPEPTQPPAEPVRLDGVRERLRGLGQRVRTLQRRSRVLAPVGAVIDDVTVLRAQGGEPRRLVVTWSIPARDDPQYSTRSGVFVWQPPADPLTKPGLLHSWELAYALNLRPQAQHVVVGTPSAWTREASAGLDITLTTGDLTDDGYPEILTFEASGGSGGCGTWRVLSGQNGAFDSLLRRETCEADIAIRNGNLRIDQSYQPKGCDAIHGCARRRTVLRWDGSGFERISRRTIARF